MTNNHISYIVCVSHPYVISSGFLEYQKRMLHSNTGCIYETALHCSFSCVSSKLLAERMHTDTMYICVASRSCASSCAFLVLSLENAFPQLKHFNNLLLVCEFKCDWEDGFQRMYIYTDYNWMACLQCASLNVFKPPIWTVAKLYWLPLFVFSLELCVFMWALKPDNWENVELHMLHLIEFFTLPSFCIWCFFRLPAPEDE